MNEFELIGLMLADLNQRISHLERNLQESGFVSHGDKFEELHSRFNKLTEEMTRVIRNSLRE